MYSSQSFRSSTSPSENFQFFSGSSMRSRNRRFCSSFDTCRKNFRISDAVARQIALERADVLEALLPDVLGHELGGQFLFREKLRMHAHDQHFFVVGAVENADPPALGKALVRAPQEVVVELFAGWAA